jgi:hypothetical protein
MMNSPGSGFSPFPEEANTPPIKLKLNRRDMIFIEKRMMPLFGRVVSNIAAANLGAKIATAILPRSPFRI